MKKEYLVWILAGGAAIWAFFWAINGTAPLGGNITPQFSTATNSSSTVTTNGEVIITRANNTRGIYLSITNSGNVPVFCGLTTNTSTLQRAGRLLGVSSTANWVWELQGYAGPVSCLSPSGTGEVNFVF